MSVFNHLLLLFCFFFITCSAAFSYSNLSLSFPLKIDRRSNHWTDASLYSTSSGYKTLFNYSTILIVSLLIGSDTQLVEMVLDTGSELSWFPCQTNPTRQNFYFDPSTSKTFNTVTSNHIPCAANDTNDHNSLSIFSLPDGLCRFSLSYIDGSIYEGTFVREYISLSVSETPRSRSILMGCVNASQNPERGILGMNFGKYSFATQMNLSKFSYCVSGETGRDGSMYVGRNPHSNGFKYFGIMKSVIPESSPSYNPYTYTIPVQGMTVGGTKMKISKFVFRSNAMGSGQTIIDSATEYTYLVDNAYDSVRDEVVRRLKGKANVREGYKHQWLDTCFDGNAGILGNEIGNITFLLPRTEIVVGSDRVMVDVGNGVCCLGIGRSKNLMGDVRNIIGIFYQADNWIEYNLEGMRLGIGHAKCSESM